MVSIEDVAEHLKAHHPERFAPALAATFVLASAFDVVVSMAVAQRLDRAVSVGLFLDMMGWRS